MVPMNELLAAVAVAKSKSFRAAAANIGSSRSAISHAIASLELRLNTRLFNRSTRSLSLTEAGRSFLDGVVPALEAIRETIDALGSDPQALSGTLRINTFPEAARRLMEPVFLEFGRRYPAVEIDLTTESQKIDIVAAGFDLGIRLAGTIPLDMISIPTGYSIDFVTVASATYLETHGQPAMPSDLNDHRCIRNRMPDGSLASWKIRGQARRFTMDLKGTFILDEPHLIRQAVLAHAGIGNLPRWHVESDLEAGTLVEVLEEWSEKPIELCLYFPRGKHVPRPLRALIDLVKEGRVEAKKRLS